MAKLIGIVVADFKRPVVSVEGGGGGAGDTIFESFFLQALINAVIKTIAI